MYRKGEFPDVKHFVGVICTGMDTKEAVRSRIANLLGPLDMESEPFPFDMTEYYRDEMGDSLFRVFFSLEQLHPADQMIPIKKTCLKLESEFEMEGNRRVNLDPGYLDLHKLVLASEKFRGHKIYLTDGICADMTLLLNRNSVTTFPWTFPDFSSDRYVPFILAMRNRYRDQLRANA